MHETGSIAARFFIEGHADISYITRIQMHTVHGGELPTMSEIKTWWQAFRPFAFTASITPVLLGSAVAAAYFPALRLDWLNFVIAIAGAMLVHTGTNLFNDYYDFKSGVDREGTYGSSGVIVGGKLRPGQVFRAGVIAFALATVTAIIIAFRLNSPSFFIGLCVFGLLSGVFYTATPVSLKYLALGDILVFICMGVLMTVGSFYIQVEQISWLPVMYSIPISLLVTAILHGNNVRDRANDQIAGINTLAITAGERGAVAFYVGLVAGAYLWIPVLILFYGTHPAILITFLSAPLAYKALDIMIRHRSQTSAEFIMIDARTAQLHTAFGLLMSASLVIQRLIS